MKHLHQIFEKLHLTRDNGLFITTDNEWQGLFSNRIERLIKSTIQPDAFFCIDNKPFILFFENLSSKKDKLKEIWNFNESPIVIISEGDSLEIYNGFEYLTSEESLRLFGSFEKLDDFSYFELVTGKTWEKYSAYFSYNNRIDHYLLKNIKEARNRLISVGMSPRLANSLLGKIIFVRYLIDRKVKLDFEREGQSRNWTNSEFCELLLNKNKVKQFFLYLKKKFNGDLFPIEESEIDSIHEDCLSIVVNLLSGNEVSSGQISLFDLYDFSIIPVEFISNVYELFIGQDEQESQGAYYTPLFLVDYILSETVEKRFKNHEGIYNCKVLDPSCGSGIFLVETLRKIIEQFQKNNPSYLDNPEEYKRQLKQLALDNIFGIDKDQSAINVAIFSIYLTLLDYQEPGDIESFKFPLLYKKNFFSEDFFNLEAAFNEYFDDLSFDFILGNPPWKRGKGDRKPLFDQYIIKRRKSEKDEYHNAIEISNSEIAQAFILRVSDFCQPSTQIGFIATSKVLYNINAIGFRKYFLDRFIVNKVFELAPVRKEVFDKSNDKAVAPAVILFYQSAFEKNTDENIIEHITLKPSRFFSLFKVFTIQRGDYKRVNQKQLKEFDYLWKILVYGNYLDFNLILRLKKEYPNLGDVISDEHTFLVGQGAMIGGGDKNSALHLVGKPFIDTRKDIKAFWINNKLTNIWDFEMVHRPRNPSLYKAPMLLITEGINKYFRSVSAVSKYDLVYRSSLTAIKINDGVKNDVLHSISGILNSSFFSYFCLQTFSSSGIEREQSHDEEKFNIPFIENTDVSIVVNKIVKLKEELYSNDNVLINIGVNQIEENEKLLDSVVINSFSINDQEKSLLDYSNSIVIPMIMKHEGFERIFSSFKPESLEISEYVNLFLERFNDNFKRIDQRIIAEIYHTDQIIGVFFKLILKYEDVEPINYFESDNNKLLQILTSLGNERITDRLFIQKDIRGFEKNGFYIVKPNERKLWHKAVAYHDLNEFVDAVLVSGKKKVFNVQ